MRISVIANHKSQITNPKSQIPNHKSQMQITNRKKATAPIFMEAVGSCYKCNQSQTYRRLRATKPAKPNKATAPGDGIAVPLTVTKSNPYVPATP